MAAAHEVRESGAARAVASAGGRAVMATGGDLWATASAPGASANAGCATAAEEYANALCWGYCYRSQNCFRWPNRSASANAPCLN